MRLAPALLLVLAPTLAIAASGTGLDLRAHPSGATALAIFVIAYLLVIAEEFTKLRKSKPVILAAGLIWTLTGIVYTANGASEIATAALRHNLLEYGELLLFLLAAMTYINAMEERLVFEPLRGWLVLRHLSYRALFWATGALAFFISPVADNHHADHGRRRQPVIDRLGGRRRPHGAVAWHVYLFIPFEMDPRHRARLRTQHRGALMDQCRAALSGRS